MMQLLINLNLEIIINILLFILSISSSISLVIFKNPIYKILMFLCILIINAIIWVMLSADFLSILVILLYIASSIVLFLFTIMMFDFKNHYNLCTKKINIKTINAITISVLFTTIFIYISKDYIYLVKLNDLKNNFSEFINILSTKYLIFFVLVGLILLLPMIAIISINIIDQNKKNKFVNSNARKIHLLDVI